MASMHRSLFSKKPARLLLKERGGDHGLRPVLGPLQLTSLGVGAIIGAGIFVLTGVVAKDKAGPAIMLSFVVAGIACVFAALCYAEFASMVPVAGSAYTYAYATWASCSPGSSAGTWCSSTRVGAATRGARLVALLPGLPRICSASIRRRPSRTRRSTTIRPAAQFVATGVGHQPAGGADRRPCSPMVLVKGIRESAGVQRRHGDHQGGRRAVRDRRRRLLHQPGQLAAVRPLRLYRHQLLRQHVWARRTGRQAARRCWPARPSSSSPTSASTRSRPTPRKRGTRARRADRHHRLACSSARSSTSPSPPC